MDVTGARRHDLPGIYEELMDVYRRWAKIASRASGDPVGVFGMVAELAARDVEEEDGE